jgi:hypothetical protein
MHLSAGGQHIPAVHAACAKLVEVDFLCERLRHLGEKLAPQGVTPAIWQCDAPLTQHQFCWL